MMFAVLLQVGFLTFDSSLHFYNISAKLSAPQMMVCALRLLPPPPGLALFSCPPRKLSHYFQLARFRCYDRITSHTRTPS